jgi:hypothetical protein
VNVVVRLALIALAAALIAALSATPASATHSRGKCKARGTTIAKNDSGRVYEREQEAEVTSLWGCLWSKNRPVLMEVAEGDDFTTFESYDSVLLRGQFVAWTFTHEDVSCKADCPPGYDATTEYVKTFDMKRRRGDFATSEASPGSLRLNTRGSLAWLEPAEPGTFAVQAWDAAGQRAIETGPIRRFRLRGTRLSWINGEVNRSETLSGRALLVSR